MDRNLYDDNIWDVSSIEDLKEVTQLNLLSKDDQYVLFEMGKDFWRYDIEKDALYQYGDYVSMEKDVNAKLAYKQEDGEIQGEMYGKLIKEVLEEIELSKIENYSLKERKNYILNADGSVDGALRRPIDVRKKIERGMSVQKTVEDALSKALKGIDTPEMKPVLDLLKVSIGTLSMFLSFLKRDRVNSQNERIMNSIIDKLDKKELSLSKVMEDKELMREIPELKPALERFAEKHIHLSKDSFENKSVLRKILNDVIYDDSVKDVAERVSESRTFKARVAEKLSMDITRELDKIQEIGYDDRMIKMYADSGFADPLDFAEQIFADNIEDLFKKDNKISANDCILATLYMAQMVNPNPDENYLTKDIGYVMDRELQPSKTKISSIVHIADLCISRTIAKKQENIQRMKI